MLCRRVAAFKLDGPLSSGVNASRFAASNLRASA